MPVKVSIMNLRCGEQQTENNIIFHIFLLRNKERKIKSQEKAKLSKGLSLSLFQLIVQIYVFVISLPGQVCTDSL